MKDKRLTITTTESPHPTISPLPRRAARWQFSLRTMLLLMAVAGVWLADYVNRQQIPMLLNRVARFQQVARELQIKNPEWLTVIKAEKLWRDEHRWDVYLPDQRYELAVAIEGLEKSNFPKPIRTIPLPQGRVQVVMEYHDDHMHNLALRVLLAGQEVIAIEKPREWAASGYGIGPNDFRESKQLPPEEPAVLYRRWGHNAKRVGLLLWIRRVPE